MMAYRERPVVDPTGAGDSFAGAFLGYLDKIGRFGPREIRRAAAQERSWPRSRSRTSESTASSR